MGRQLHQGQANSVDFGTGGVALTADVTANNLTVGGVVAGGFGLTKSAAGTLLLTNPASTYTGPTTVTAGTLQVGSLLDGGAPSGVGQSSNAAANPALNCGTLYVLSGGAAATDRGITVSANSRFGLLTAGARQTFTGTATLAFGPNTNTAGQDTRHTLTADNSAFTRGVTLSNGTLVVTKNTSLGSGTKTVTVQVSTTGFVALRLDPRGGPDITPPNTFNYVTSATAVNGGTVNVAGSDTLRGNATMAGGNGATGFQSNAGTLTFSGRAGDGERRGRARHPAGRGRHRGRHPHPERRADGERRRRPAAAAAPRAPRRPRPATTS